MRNPIRRLAAIGRKRPIDRDLDSEISSHIDFATEENIRRGMPFEEARRQALVSLGGVEQAREQHREARGVPALETLFQDLRYAFRTIARDPAFTAIVILILGLGIGANVSVFSVVNTILLRPLPFHDPQRLMWLTANQGKGGLSGTTFTVAAFEEFQRHNKSFEQVTNFQTFYNSIQYKLTGYPQPLPVFGVQVAENFFQTLGVQPSIGRLFAHEECQKDGRPVAILSHAFWRRQYLANPAIIGQAVRINDQSVTVIGVLPPSFDFGSVFSPGLQVDFYVPAVMDFWRTWGNTLAVVGRLRPGVTVAQAQAESNVLFPQLKAAHKDWYEDYLATIWPLGDYVSGKLRRSLIVLWGAVALILLIVCANLSNLLLARATARSKEFAMRRALGAGRGRIVRQFLTETLVLSFFGAILGLCCAFAVTRYLAHQSSIALPLLSSIRVDGSALAWTSVIAISCAVLFGIVPALRISGGNLQDDLKDSGFGMSQGRKHELLRATLVVSEIALASVLLIGAGLLLRSFLHVLDVDLGFQPEHAYALKIDYDDDGKPERRGPILQNILDHVRAMPGIEAAGVSDMLPLDRNRSWGLEAKGRNYRPGELQGILVYIVTPGYFRAMGMHFVGGRDFSWHDSTKGGPVVIINEAAARFHWLDQDPIGRIALVNGREAPVVGVIANVRESSVEEGSSPQMYLPITQWGPEGTELVVRTRLQPSLLQSTVMRTLRVLKPAQPLTQFRPIQQIVDHAISPRRFFALLVMIFAALGLILASLGIYGVISYSVTRQQQEIGIRMALGATQARVQLGVMLRTLRLTLLGVFAGAVVALGVSRLIASLLFGTAPTDPLSFLAALLALALVALLGGYIPGRRASRLDPMHALRNN